MCKNFNELLSMTYFVIYIINILLFCVCMGIYFTKILSPICPDKYVYMEHKKCKQCVYENITLIDFLNCKNGIPPDYTDVYFNSEVDRQMALIGIYVSISIFILNGIFNIIYHWCNYEKPEKPKPKPENENENEKSESSISCV